MHIELNFLKFKESILTIDRVAGKHLTLPVLSCILIEVKDNVATFKATNLDIGVEVSVPVKSNENGVFAVPAHIISSFLSQIPNDNQLIKIDNVSGNLLLTTASSKGTIKTQAFDDFPPIPKISEGQEFTIQTELFIKGLKSVWYSSSVSSIKPELASVYIYKDAGDLVFAATDSFRLAEKRVKMANISNFSDILIPFKNIADIIRLLENIKDNLKVITNKNLISFENKDFYLVSRLTDGVFPDYKQIIPKSFATEITLLKQELINALRVSNIFTDKFNQVHFSVDPEDKSIKVQTKNSDIGENTTTVEAKVSGDKMEINFNSKYINDCFQSIDSDSITLQLSGMNRPMVIRPVSTEQNFMYLVMPMNR